MALQILEINGMYYLQGRINAGTSEFLLNHLLPQLNSSGKMDINIDDVSEIDTNGLSTIEYLYNHATSNKKEFTITGYGCKDIYDHLRYPQVA